MDFSLLFFPSQEPQYRPDRYQLLIEAARFADKQGLRAIWIPERHFHEFGGSYPNPSVIAAALATATHRVRLRAGSVVLPLHHPVRVAEEWSVVDNLSNGRVDLAIARGWNPNDFVLAPDNYAPRTDVTVTGIDVLRRLWRGEAVRYRNGTGEETEVRLAPLPRQGELPLWLTCTGGEAMFARAGELGANVLTGLLFQSVEELARKVACYRAAREAAGFDPDSGHVTLMVHTFLGADEASALATARDPFRSYLESSVGLWGQKEARFHEQSPRERDVMLTLAVNRYARTAALFGTPESVTGTVSAFREAGVNEIACLIDFGIDPDTVLAGLRPLRRLMEQVNPPGARATAQG
ncbi:MupA/Atu3671 family FMN-dependent luciferase-like monooxygenase [Nocardiopsis gilva]|nr:MupA/Atu3671 family FMN-dependent luciferase-like monooxygenase [Nocardiopsis gilva]